MLRRSPRAASPRPVPESAVSGDRPRGRSPGLQPPLGRRSLWAGSCSVRAALRSQADTRQTPRQRAARSARGQASSGGASISGRVSTPGGLDCGIVRRLISHPLALRHKLRTQQPPGPVNPLAPADRIRCSLIDDIEDPGPRKPFASRLRVRSYRALWLELSQAYRGRLYRGGISVRLCEPALAHGVLSLLMHPGEGCFAHYRADDQQYAGKSLVKGQEQRFIQQRSAFKAFVEPLLDFLRHRATTLPCRLVHSTLCFCCNPKAHRHALAGAQLSSGPTRSVRLVLHLCHPDFALYFIYKVCLGNPVWD